MNYKKHIILALSASVGLASLAQEALWSAGPLVSPQVNDSKTVTFRLFAPTASEVKITGDFLPKKFVDTEQWGRVEVPRDTALTKNDNGVWEFTSDVLAPELYNYAFIVDNVKMTDPANVYTVRDVASVTNYFIVPGDRASLYGVGDVPHGTVSKVWYDSPTVDMKRRMTVYTPAGYEDSDRTYPVLYLLHGMGGDEEAWTSLGRAAQILDNLIARGKVEPMIVVMPNGNIALEAAPGESHYGLVAPSMNVPNTMDGTFELSFPDIINYVDTHYRTRADKSGRAIAGLSMGGFHTAGISRFFPDKFDYVGLFSAAILPRDDVKSPVYENIDAKIKQQFADAPKLYWIGIGKTDFLYDVNKDYRARLDSMHIPYTYYESDGGHIWRNWRIYLTEFLPLLFK